MQAILTNEGSLVVKFSIGLPNLVLPHLVGIVPLPVGDDVDFERAVFPIDGQPSNISILVNRVRLLEVSVCLRYKRFSSKVAYQSISIFEWDFPRSCSRSQRRFLHRQFNASSSDRISPNLLENNRVLNGHGQLDRNAG